MEEVLTITYQRFVESRNRQFEGDLSALNIQKVSKWLCEGNRNGLLLYGTIGSGKTTLMETIIKALTILAPEIRKYRQSAIDITNEAKRDTDKFNDIKKCEMLFIDDLGEEPLIVKNFGNEISPIVELLYYRYDKQLFTIITTNLLDDQIAPTYGERIKDRFNEMFDRVYFDIKSFRK